MKSRNAGFTLIELLIYAGIFVTVTGTLTLVLTNTLRVQNQEAATTEVSQQLNFVLDTIQRLVGDASLIDSVYQTGAEGTPCTDSTDYCTIKLRLSADNVDPTWIIGEASGIRVVQGDSGAPDSDDATDVTITNDSIVVDYARFTKLIFEGGHETVRANLSFTYNTDNPKFAVSKTIQSAIGRVTAATFDSDLVPNSHNAYDVGQTATRWQDGFFSGSLDITGNLTLGGTCTGCGGAWTQSGSDIYYTTGNVGIGTTGPSENLVVGDDLGGYPGNRISLGDASSYGTLMIGASSSNRSFIQWNPSHYFKIGTVESGTTYDNLLVLNDGNVGIGTTGPGNKLVVANTSPASQWTHSGIGDGNFSLELGQNSAGNVGSIKLWGYDSGHYIFLRPSNGNYHIDSSRGNYYFNWDEGVRGANNAVIHIADEAGNEDISLNTAGNSWFNGGNVGIGMSNPSYKLDVTDSNDTFRFSSTGNNAQVGSFVGGSDNGNYEWVGWYSGGSRAGIFLWDGSWNGCSATRFCIFGDSHQLMLASNVDDVLINDGIKVASMVNIGNWYTVRWASDDLEFGYYSSSRRYKKDIVDYATEFNPQDVYKLRPVVYSPKDEELETNGVKRYQGLIAEEVYEIYPDLVPIDQEGRPDAVSYDVLSVPILAAVQEQKEVDDRHDAQIAILVEELESITGKEIDIESVSDSNGTGKAQSILGASLLGGLVGAGLILLLLRRKV